MSQSYRVGDGLIDRSQLIDFSFNGERMHGFQGDTVASALLANGHHFVGRSFKYHRPRGIFSAGPEEPNALLTVGTGAKATPNSRATTVEIERGLKTFSQNHKGSLRYDRMAVNDLLSPFLSAGFYYKTFMWPQSFWEKIYEPAIRNAAGLGALSGEDDPDIYDKGFLHTDLLVIGAGPAGLMAALTAARAGKRVILADEDFVAGGRLNAETHEVDGKPGSIWAQSAIQELKSFPHARIMKRTTIFGAFDHGTYGALERHGGPVRQTLWRIYTKRAIVAAGSTERSIAFSKNDRPGIMLAGSVRTYANRFGVAAGRNVALYTNNDDGWRTASDLIAHGVNIAAIIDARPHCNITPPKDVPVYFDGRIVDTNGRHRLHSIALPSGRVIPCDALAVAGGWNPNVHLTCHHRGRPTFDDSLQAFIPGGELPPGMSVAGAAAGHMTLGQCLASGQKAAASTLDLKANPADLPQASDEPSAITPFWYVADGHGRAWVDLQNDVTVKDIKLAEQEGFSSVEHLKRYTTLGMATDQGKTANVLGLAIQAELTGRTISETGTTIFRPPYTPVAIGAFAGRAKGKDFRPTRLTPSHDWATAQGAVFVEVGAWLRAQWFPQPGETHWRQSVDREVTTVRTKVGFCDVSTLGKIDIKGPGATQLVNFVYANAFAKLAVGKTRYGLMLREDGLVMDDGTTARLAENHYLMTTTTANAVGVFRHLEFVRQCLLPNLDVHLQSVTDQWAQFSIAGPRSRDLLQAITDQTHDLSNEAFPFMACGEITICDGVPARLFRISFSGELAYEIAVPARYGNALAEKLMEAGKPMGITPYGTEALGVMRIEKGHPAGNELDGRTTAKDLGLEKMVSAKKDFIGSILHKRPGLIDDTRPRLMGFKPANPKDDIHAGAHLITPGNEFTMANDEGWISSVAFSPTLGHSIALGFLKNGAERIGETVHAIDRLRGHEIDVTVASPHFVDPDGEKLRA